MSSSSTRWAQRTSWSRNQGIRSKTFQHALLAARAYRLEAWAGDSWQPLSTMASHQVRFRRSVHGFPVVTSARLRIVIQQSAEAEEPPTLCEIRVYNEPEPVKGVSEAG